MFVRVFLWWMEDEVGVDKGRNERELEGEKRDREIKR